MNWDAIATVSEVVGAGGVIVTLIYLAIQVRASTAATETENRVAIANGYREVLTLNMDEELARAFRNGLWDYPEMPFNSRIKFANLCAHDALLFQGAFAQHESGQLDQETYDGYLSWFAGIVTTPGGANWWEEMGKPIFNARMVEEVARRIEVGGLHDIRNTRHFGRPDGDT
jgi:hypothetical protein